MALGAYQAESSRGSVLNALAHPSVVNPVADLNTAYQAAGNLMSLRLQQQNLAVSQQNQNLSRLNYSAGIMADLLNQPGKISGDQVRDALQAHVNDGVYPQSFVDAVEAGMPTNTDDMRGWVRQHQIANLNQQQQVMAGFNPRQFDLGGQTVVQNVPTMPGSGGAAAGPSTSFNTTLSPAEATHQVTFQADQAYVQNHPGVTLGQTVMRPLNDVLREQGQSWALPPGAKITVGPTGGGGGGVVNADGTPASSANPPRLLKVPGSQGGGGGSSSAPAPAATTGTPAPPGGSGGAYTGGGVGTVLSQPPAQAAPSASGSALPTPPVPPANTTPTAPSVAPLPVVSTSPTLRGPGSPVAPAPSVNAPRDSMTPGPAASAAPPATPAVASNALAGGVPVASANPLTAPTLGRASAPSAAVPADVAAMLRGVEQARAAPATGTQTAGDMAVGPGSQEIEENKRSGELLTAHDNAAANYPQTVFPYTQALNQYGRGVTTAPGADILNTSKGWINGIARSIGLPEPSSSTEIMDTLHKYLTQIVSGNPVAAGSDARLAAVLAGNANTSIHELAGSDMIKAGIALQRLTVALDTGWHAMTPQQQAQYGGSYLNYLRAQAPNVDVRALGRDLYNPAQLKTLNEEIQNGSEADAQKFMNTLTLARQAGIVGGVKAMP